MSKFYGYHQKSRVHHPLKSTTLLGAKQELTSARTFGGGSLILCQERAHCTAQIAKREFLPHLGRWGRWVPLI